MNELALLPLLTDRVTFWIVRLDQVSPACLPGFLRMAGEWRARTVSAFSVTSENDQLFIFLS